LRILFLTPYPFDEAPSQRFRFEQYFPLLREKGISFKQSAFLDENTWSILYKSGYTYRKVSGIISGFLRRFGILFTVLGYDFVFIHREAAPVGPPVFEWIIAKIFRRRIIYDFDDAIWLPNTSESNKLAAGLKWHHKVANICRWSHVVSCGNEYLCNYARQFNQHVVLNPTTIDTEKLHNPELYAESYAGSKNKIIIGWTGSHSTLLYLDLILPVLQEIERNHLVEIRIISNQEPDLPLKTLVFKKWSKETEIRDLAQFDIGLMPLTEDHWSEGKCGFKALQYMAMEIPALASPVGVNKTIVQEGVNGYLCGGLEDWKEKLEQLIRDASLRKELGKKGRETVVKHYSVKSNEGRFLGMVGEKK
jgi:glycosyltransferase involved in cell wall biosynthesis